VIKKLAWRSKSLAPLIMTWNRGISEISWAALSSIGLNVRILVGEQLQGSLYSVAAVLSCPR
jgi:hypothetical protein